MNLVKANCAVCGGEFDWDEDDRCPHCGTIIDG